MFKQTQPQGALLNHRAGIKDQLLENFKEGGVNLNIGCGPDYLQDFINIDGSDEVNCDMKCILGEDALPFKDNSVDGIFTSHVLEHIWDLPFAKDEMQRVLKPGGVLVIIVPNYLSLDAWGDATHIRGFSLHSFLGEQWPCMDYKRASGGYTQGVKDLMGNDLTWIVWIGHKRESGEVGYPWTDYPEEITEDE